MRDVVSFITELSPHGKKELLPAQTHIRHLKQRYNNDENGAFKYMRPAIKTVSYRPMTYYVRDEVQIIPPFHIAFTKSELFLDQAFRLNPQEKIKTLGLLSSRWREEIEKFDMSKFIDRRIEGEVLIASTFGAKDVWGHWVVQQVPRCLLFLEHFPAGRIAIPHVLIGRTFHEILLRFGVPEEKIVPISRRAPYMIERAVFMDYPYSQHSIHPLGVELLQAGLNKILASKDYEEAASTGSRVFVERDVNGSRGIKNMSEVADLAKGFGFEVLPLGAKPFLVQVKAWREAEAVIGVSGSDLTNIVFSGESTKAGSLTPVWFRDSFFSDLAAAFGVDWYESFCPDIADNGIKSTFHVPLDEARRIFTAITT